MQVAHVSSVASLSVVPPHSSATAPGASPSAARSSPRCQLSHPRRLPQPIYRERGVLSAFRAASGATSMFGYAAFERGVGSRFRVGIDADFAGALRSVERESARDPWGLHAASMAHGIQKSGVVSAVHGLEGAVERNSAELAAGFSALEASNRAIETEARGIRSAVISLAAVNAAGFKAVCEALGESNATLHNIERMIASPLSTAAAERYRRGRHAMSEEWFEDALVEFDAAAQMDPFQPITHFSRGLALGALDRRSEAFSAFSDACRYAGKAPELRPLAAGAAILAAQAAESSNRSDEAVALLSQIVSRIPECAETWLALAKITAREAPLRRALQIAPELAMVALAGKVAGARHVAESVFSDKTGAVQGMLRAIRYSRSLGMSAHVPSTMPEIMSFHAVWRPALAEKELQAAKGLLADERRLASDLRARELASESVKSPVPIPPVSPPAVVSLVIASMSLVGVVLAHMASLPVLSVSFGVVTVFAALYGLPKLVRIHGQQYEASVREIRRQKDFERASAAEADARRLHAAVEPLAESARRVVEGATAGLPARVLPLEAG